MSFGGLSHTLLKWMRDKTPAGDKMEAPLSPTRGQPFAPRHRRPLPPMRTHRASLHGGGDRTNEHINARGIYLQSISIVLDA